MHDSLTMLSDGAEFLLITELCFTDKLLIKYKSLCDFIITLSQITLKCNFMLIAINRAAPVKVVVA